MKECCSKTYFVHGKPSSTKTVLELIILHSIKSDNTHIINSVGILLQLNKDKNSSYFSLSSHNTIVGKLVCNTLLYYLPKGIPLPYYMAYILM